MLELLYRLLHRTPSRDGFARLVAKAISASGAVQGVTYDRDAFSLRLWREDEQNPDTSTATIHLANTFAEYCAAPRPARSTVVDQLVCSVQEANGQTAPTLARSHLHLSLKSRGWAARQQTGTPPSPIVHRPLGESLALCLCLDHEASIRYVSAADLAEWNLEEEAAWELGRAGLERRSDEPFEEVQPGVYRSPWQDGYDAARVAYPWVLERLPVAGAPVVAVPNRDCLLVAGADDPEAVARLAAVAEEEFRQPRAITPRLFYAGSGSLTPLRLPRQHPSFLPVEHLRALALTTEYSSQREALEAERRAAGRDTVVADVMVIASPGGPDQTCTIWSDGKDRLLPETDLVAFTRNDGEQHDGFRIYPFERVREAAGGLMTPLGGYPPRYLVRIFPSDAQLAAMGDPVLSHAG